MKPDLVLSHEAPSCVKEKFGNPGFMGKFGWGNDFESTTNQLLQILFEIHQPKNWYNSHYHSSGQVKYKETHFQCLNELETVEIV